MVETTTIPVILIGVGKRVLTGFSEVEIEFDGGVHNYRGAISAEMINDKLVICVEEYQQGDKKDVPPPDTSGTR